MTPLDAAEIVALAERVEAATGPDRELDRDVFALILIPGRRLAGDERDIVATEDRRGAHFLRHIKAYTASIDAAMTLVPEGCLFHVRTLWDGPQPWGYAHVHTYAADAEDCDGKRHLDDYAGMATTPALALTAAALRARAALLSDRGEG
jgi:hypothetical protein